jgi:hypothetical protein
VVDDLMPFLAQRLIETVSRMEVVHNLKITVSAGVAVGPTGRPD